MIIYFILEILTESEVQGFGNGVLERSAQPALRPFAWIRMPAEMVVDPNEDRAFETKKRSEVVTSVINTSLAALERFRSGENPIGRS